MIAELGIKQGARLKRAAQTTAEDYLYHSWQNRQAGKLIDSMTSEGGVQQNPALFKQCDEYARDVLGSQKYSPWLKAYTMLAGTFKEGWIPDNYYGRVVGPRLQSLYGEVSHLKALSSRLFQTNLLPDLAYAVNGILCTASMEPIKRSELKKYLFATSDKVVYKLDNGGQGKSVYVYDVNNFPDETTPFRNGVFQKYIVQHSFFDAFSTQSVSTLRITTVVDDDSNTSCRAAYLRLPRSAETHVKSETAVKVVVNLTDGQLSETAYLPNWVSIDTHPDSKQPFSGQVVPNFAACVEACVSLHKELPLARAIGWDLIVDAQGNVAIMEWNGQHNDIKFSEAAGGPCFADLGWQHLWKTPIEIDLRA